MAGRIFYPRDSLRLATLATESNPVAMAIFGRVMTPKEAEELTVLWTNAQSVVAAYIRTLVPNLNESEELLQRTAVTLVRKFHDYDRGRPFSAWAVGVAKYEVLTYWREQSTDRHVFDAALLDQITESYRRLAQDRLPVRELLSRCIEVLAGRAREAIRLRYAAQLTTLQLAETLNMSHGAARMLLTRARNALRHCVEDGIKRLNAQTYG